MTTACASELRAGALATERTGREGREQVEMNENTEVTTGGALNLTGATIATLLTERDAHTKAITSINFELGRRAGELEAAIGKPKRTRKARADKGKIRGGALHPPYGEAVKDGAK